MQFSFFHISDLHYDTESVSGEVFRDELKKQIEKDELNADCLIISGDLFNRGKLNQEDVERFKKFLHDIPGHGFTVVVPGNHDLDRSARKKKEDSYNTFLTRKKIVLEKGNEAFAKGQFLLDEDEKDILYKGAYEDFFAFSRLMGFKSFNQEVPALEAKCYEVQQVSFPEPDFPCLIRFVLLNTGLIAGQSVSGNEYRKIKERIKVELDEAIATGDPVKAAKVQVKLAKQQKRYEDDGEMIIDEEDYKEDGPGRLSLSKKGLEALSEIQAPDTMLTIFVGHHGYQFLSTETKKALKTAMENCKSGIYLCGHSHQAKYKRFKIGENTAPKDIDQIQAGVMFKDEDGYTQYGFDHGVLYIENDKIVCDITSYFLAKSASGKLHWVSEKIEIPLGYIKLASQTERDENVQSPDKSEADENKVSPTDDSLDRDPQKPPGGKTEVLPAPPGKPSPTSGPASFRTLRQYLINKHNQPESVSNKKEE